jgi:hypothetical protein
MVTGHSLKGENQQVTVESAVFHLCITWLFPNPNYSRARTTRAVKILNLSPKIEISDFHVFQRYVSLKFLFSAKSSAS